MRLQSRQEQIGATEDAVDEIRQWQDSRYISSTECCWRLFAYPIHQQYPSICSLTVHLPNAQNILFRDTDDIEQVLQRDHETTLTAWFSSNRRDASAREYYYIDIPKHYCYRNKRWHRRRKPARTIGRIYFVCPRDFERYSLRLLLLHVKGATNFNYLKTGNGTLYHTFQAAARACGLLRNGNNGWNA